MAKNKKIDKDDISDPEEIKRRDKMLLIKQLQNVEELRYLLKQKEFRNFVWELLSDCKMFETSFTGNSTTFFNEGMRQVGLTVLMQVISVNPDAYVTMIKESQQRDNLEKEKQNA